MYKLRHGNTSAKTVIDMSAGDMEWSSSSQLCAPLQCLSLQKALSVLSTCPVVVAVNNTKQITCQVEKTTTAHRQLQALLQSSAYFVPLEAEINFYPKS